MSFTQEDYTKMKLIDTVINAIPSEEILKLAEADLITAKLAGVQTSGYGLLNKLVAEDDHIRTELSQLREELKNEKGRSDILKSDILTLRGQLHSLVKCLNSGHINYSNNSDFVYLKNQLGIY